MSTSLRGWDRTKYEESVLTLNPANVESVTARKFRESPEGPHVDGCIVTMKDGKAHNVLGKKPRVEEALGLYTPPGPSEKTAIERVAANQPDKVTKVSTD